MKKKIKKKSNGLTDVREKVVSLVSFSVLKQEISKNNIKNTIQNQDSQLFKPMQDFALRALLENKSPPEIWAAKCSGVSCFSPPFICTGAPYPNSICTTRGRQCFTATCRAVSLS